ncbi:MAG: M28 family peptidase [Candidatus Eremiobacteraeota bacterium]|nr:M28 family peptidase [Candidatus Eremiobacteraeota bacterium]MBC5804463.1 M28 family peptidase [Candidatus Eremiobacteraeota bacterium]MBC5821220.1 M28 family peptidase [Candidatus Eremiobacteraeota bacterium]
MPVRLARVGALVCGAALCAIPVTAQTPPAAASDAPVITRDPQVTQALDTVSPARLRADDERLVGFGTRNALSERSPSRTRGIIAARDWIAARFREIAQASGGRMTVAFDAYVQPATPRTGRPVAVSSVVATLRGDDPQRGLWVMSSHFDDCNGDCKDPVGDAPGADDNGSAVSGVLEAARALAPLHLRGTLAFVCFDGEDQGLWGSQHYAKTLRAAGVRVEGNLNNDIIGASVAHDGRSVNDVARVFSEALPLGAVPRTVNLIGTENDSPSRELARAVREIDAAYVPAVQDQLIYRADRFLRGGDQESFTAVGYPAVRFVEGAENFDHQHQNVRVENGVQYGDLPRFLDFEYLAHVTQLNVAALATLALAPAAPVATLAAKKLGYDTTLAWNVVPAAASYEVLWRRTDEPTWTHAKNMGNVTTATLPLSKDDWIFGVRSLDAAGHASVATYPTPLLR